MITCRANLVPRVSLSPRPLLSLLGAGRERPWERGCCRATMGARTFTVQTIMGYGDVFSYFIESSYFLVLLDEKCTGPLTHTFDLGQQVFHVYQMHSLFQALGSCVRAKNAGERGENAFSVSVPSLSRVFRSTVSLEQAIKGRTAK